MPTLPEEKQIRRRSGNGGRIADPSHAKKGGVGEIDDLALGI